MDGQSLGAIQGTTVAGENHGASGRVCSSITIQPTVRTSLDEERTLKVRIVSAALGPSSRPY